MPKNLTLTPKLAGILTQLGAAWFWLGFVIFGQFQPGYQPIKDTISILAVGKYGFIQEFNFLVLAGAILIFGLGLSQAIYAKKISWLSVMFGLMSLGAVGLIIFPVDPRDTMKLALNSFSSFHGAAHFSITMTMGAVMSVLSVAIYRALAKQTYWQSMLRPTLWLLGLGILGGIIWLFGRVTGLSYAWKGLLQKTIITDALIWVWLMSRKLINWPDRQTSV